MTSSDLNAKTDRGKTLINKVMPYFKDTNCTLAWTTLERQASKSEMFALILTYGAGGYFFTISPGMKDQRFAMRMMQRLRTKSDEWEPLPTDTERNKLCTENPVECARVYDMITRAIYSELVCSGLSNGSGGYRSSKVIKDSAKKGAFGWIPASHAVTEAQGKGGLHSHGIGFQFVYGMALKRFAHDEEKAREVYDAIDSHISGELASRDTDK